MSKRYGRNQKRRHREALALAVQKCEGYARALDKSQENLRDIVSKIESIQRYSVALPAKTVHGDAPREYRLPAVQPEFWGWTDPETLSMKCITVYRLDVDMLDRDTFEKVAQLRFNGKCVRMMLTPEALDSMPIDILINHVAGQLVKELRK